MLSLSCCFLQWLAVNTSSRHILNDAKPETGLLIEPSRDFKAHSLSVQNSKILILYADKQHAVRHTVGYVFTGPRGDRCMKTIFFLGEERITSALSSKITVWWWQVYVHL